MRLWPWRRLSRADAEEILIAARADDAEEAAAARQRLLDYARGFRR
jgi:hypothetical protein